MIDEQSAQLEYIYNKIQEKSDQPIDYYIYDFNYSGYNLLATTLNMTPNTEYILVTYGAVNGEVYITLTNNYSLSQEESPLGHFNFTLTFWYYIFTGGVFMSTYYSFYLGYTTKDGKLHAYGPFDKFNKLRPMLEKSRSFISDLYQDFYKVSIDKMDDFLYQHFTYKDPYNKESERYSDLYYLPTNELPGTDYIKRGYYTSEDITDYLTTNEPYFSDRYSEIEYGIKLSAAVKNDDKEEIDRLKKYIYFSYPDYECKEYESYVIHQFMSYNGPFDRYHMESSLKENGEELVETIILLRIS